MTERHTCFRLRPGRLMRQWSLLMGCWICGPLFAFQVFAAEEAVAVVATLSDGTVVSGDLRIIGPRPLTLVPVGQDRQQMFLFRDIVSIDQEIETSSMERPWTFKESGKADKVYSEGQYPLLNFKTRVTLISGTVVTGHVISVVMTLISDQGQQKLFLHRQIRGTLEQKLDDVVFVSTIRMTANTLTDGGRVSGAVEGFGNLISVTALDNERQQILTSHVTKDNRFDFGTVLPGTYDLCVFTDTHVLIGHSDTTPHDIAGDKLSEGDLAAINQKFPLADDFFNDRWILQLRGTRGFAKALVYKRRSEYYEAEKWTPGGFLWHLEIWSWHFAEPDWKIDHRYILIRHKQQGGEQNRKLMCGKMLDAVSPGSTLRVQAGTGQNEDWHFIRDLN